MRTASHDPATRTRDFVDRPHVERAHTEVDHDPGAVSAERAPVVRLCVRSVPADQRSIEERASSITELTVSVLAYTATRPVHHVLRALRVRSTGVLDRSPLYRIGRFRNFHRRGDTPHGAVLNGCAPLPVPRPVRAV